MTNLTPIRLVNNFSYYIFSGLCFDASVHEVHDELYDFWKKFWQDVYSQAGSLEDFRTDDFYRQHYISLVCADESPVGVVMNSAFDLSSSVTKDYSYFKYYPQKIIDQLLNDGMTKVMSYEFLTISPEWRFNKIGFSLGEVMMGLGQKIMINSGAQCGIAVARTDVRAIDIVKNVGFFQVMKNLQRKNFPVDVVLCTPQSIVPNKDTYTQNIVESLWRNRKIHRSFDFDVLEENFNKKAG